MFSFFKKKKIIAHIKLNGVIGNAGKFKQGIDFAGQEEIIEKAFSLKKAKAVDLFLSRGASELSQEPYVQVLLSGVDEHLVKIDELITTYAQDWDMDRMPAVDRNILRIAIFEILWVAEVDLKIACDEAVELAKSLSTDESSNYINGVLGRIVKLKDSIAI